MTALAPNPILTPRERDRIRPRVRRSVLDFAREHLKIVEGPGAAKEPVQWHPDTFPLQRTVLEAMDDQRWSSIVLFTCPQTFGKTLIMLAGLMHTICERGVNAFYAASTKNVAITVWNGKFRKAIAGDPELKRLLPDNPDHAGRAEERKFVNGTSMYFAGADSMANLSTFTASTIVCDDIQAMPAAIPGHGHPADIAETRAKAFAREQVRTIKAGTAGTKGDYLDRKLMGSACYVPFVPCLACDTYQLTEFERFVYDDSSAKDAADDCWMRCANADCEHQIRFEELPAMLARHRWVSMPPDADWIAAPSCETGTVMPDDAAIYPETHRSTIHCGFWASALYWPLGSTWGQYAGDYVSINADPDGVKDFNQHILGRAYKEPEIDEERLTVEQVEGLKAERHTFGTIPEFAGKPDEIVLTTAIDCQAGYLYVTVRAWNRKTGSSWLVYARTAGHRKVIRGVSESERDKIIHGRIVEALNEIYAMDAGGWPVVGADGKQIRRQSSELFLVDAGYFPDTVFAYVQARGGASGKWRAIRGSKLPAKDPKGMLWPAAPMRSRVGRRTWYEPHVNRAKLMLREILAIPPGQAGSWNLPSDMPRDTFRAYAAHMTSEVYDKAKDKWVKQAANHYYDDETYQICAAVAIGVRLPGAAEVKRSVDVKDWIKKQRAARMARG